MYILFDDELSGLFCGDVLCICLSIMFMKIVLNCLVMVLVVLVGLVCVVCLSDLKFLELSVRWLVRLVWFIVVFLVLDDF